MTFEIANGTGKVRIGIFGGQYFAFVRPLTFLWDDNQGSIGFYLCAFPYSEEYRNEIHKSISISLTNDYTDKLEELNNLLSPLWKLFSNGIYDLKFYNSSDNKFFEITNGRDPEPYLTDWNIHFGYLTKKEDEEIKRNDYQEYLKTIDEEKDIFTRRILDFTTYNIYPEDIVFLATQPKEEINWERVRYFENEISNGARPFAIVFNCSIPRKLENQDGTYVNYPYDTDYFVLDGHHKLLAYSNLKIYPPIANLKFLPKSTTDLETNNLNLQEIFFSWQATDIQSSVR